MSFKLGASSKFDNYQAVEITSSSDDLNHEPFSFTSDHGDVITFDGHDGQHHPVVDVTIHHKDGKRETRRDKSSKAYSKDPNKARLDADQEVLHMAQEARRKGVPVITHTTGSDRKRKQERDAYHPSIEWPSIEINDNGSVWLFAGVFLFGCLAMCGILYAMSLNPLNPLGLP